VPGLKAGNIKHKRNDKSRGLITLFLIRPADEKDEKKNCRFCGLEFFIFTLLISPLFGLQINFS
jgi:hypothetical protein